MGDEVQSWMQSHAPESEGQDVIYYDYSQVNDHAAYLVVSDHVVSNAGRYDGVTTVQAHLDLVDQFAISDDAGDDVVDEAWATD